MDMVKTYEIGNRFCVFKEVLKEHDERIRNIARKHPFINVVYNWIVATSIVVLVISLIIFTVNTSVERKAEKLTASAMADYQAAIDAQEEELRAAIIAEQQSEEYISTNMAIALSKVFYGINKFEEKYGYSERDFMTYARCVFNRVDNEVYSDDIYEVINQADQWVGYSDSNPVIDRYYQMALKAVQEWRNESVKPVSNEYLWAELTSNGIYLKNHFNADGYAIRWRYSQ